MKKKNYQIFHSSVKIINNEVILLAWPLNNMLQSLIVGTYRHFPSTFPSLSISPDSTSFIDWLILDLLPQSHRRYLNLHKLIASFSRLWPSWALTRSGSDPVGVDWEPAAECRTLCLEAAAHADQELERQEQVTRARVQFVGHMWVAPVQSLGSTCTSHTTMWAYWTDEITC